MIFGLIPTLEVLVTVVIVVVVMVVVVVVVVVMLSVFRNTDCLLVSFRRTKEGLYDTNPVALHAVNTFFLLIASFLTFCMIFRKSTLSTEQTLNQVTISNCFLYSRDRGPKTLTSRDCSKCVV